VTARVLAALALGVALAGCAAGGKTAPNAPAPAVVAPLTTTLGTARATWVIVPMGHLSDPVNTFWQVFVLPKSGRSWALVTPPGVADNGGLVAAATGTGQLVIGFRPSQDLSFSPLAITTDDGKIYQPDLITGGLANLPDALSTATNGDTAALVNRGATVLGRTGGTADWHQLATLTSLAASASGRACGANRITAVAVTDAETYLGLACNTDGTVGLIQLSGSSFQRVEIALPGALADDKVEVLRLIGSGDRLSALLRLTAAGLTTYAAAWTTPQHPTWTLSPTLSQQGPLISTTGTATGGMAILTRTPASGLALALIQPGDSAWAQLPTPPPSTVTVAVSGGRVDALTVDSSRFTDYTFNRATRAWEQSQVINVTIPYGSSN